MQNCCGRGDSLKHIFPNKFYSFLAALSFILTCQPTFAQPFVVAGSYYFQSTSRARFDFTGLSLVKIIFRQEKGMSGFDNCVGLLRSLSLFLVAQRGGRQMISTVLS